MLVQALPSIMPLGKKDKLKNANLRDLSLDVDLHALAARIALHHAQGGRGDIMSSITLSGNVERVAAILRKELAKEGLQERERVIGGARVANVDVVARILAKGEADAR